MIRYALLALVALSLSVSPVQASSWKVFHSKQLALSLRYPSDWHLSPSYVPGNEQVMLGFQGRSNFSLTIQLLPLRPSRRIGQTVRRVITYERKTGQAPPSGPWKAARVGSYFAVVALTKLSTEGGVPLSQASYVTQSRTHVYMVVDTVNARHAPSSVNRFPAVYRKILSTLRFR